MPRKARIKIPGAVYHVITRGLEKREIFRDNKDREEFLRRFEEGLKATKSKCYGWSLMPNHVHLIIRSGNKSLSELMRKVLTGYAIYFNKKYKRSGYLYQNRYKSILCQEDVYLLELIRYVHLNPLRSNIVINMEGLNNYKWTGHCVLLGNEIREWQSVDEILAQFGETRKKAISKYCDFITSGIGMGKREDLSGGGLRRSAGGWEEVLKMKARNEYWRGDERILGEGEFVNTVLKKSEEEMKKEFIYKSNNLNLDKLVEKVCLLTGVKKEDLKKKGRGNTISKARKLISYFGNKELKISRNKIAKLFEVSGWSISRLAFYGEKIAETDNIDVQLG